MAQPYKTDFIHAGKNTVCICTVDIQDNAWKITNDIYNKDKMLIDKHEFVIEGFALLAFKLAMGIK